MGATEDYRILCEELRIKNQETISVRYATINRRLNHDFWRSELTTLPYVGQYGRNSGTDGISDVDVFFRVPLS